MKKNLLFCTLLMVGITMMGAVKKTKLRVLYVGGHSNIETFAADYDKAEKLLAAQMREAGRRVTELGGIIGHIKFVLTTPGKCGQISVTDVEETIRHFDGTASQVEGVAIVFAVEDDELVKILTETIGSILIREE